MEKYSQYDLTHIYEKQYWEGGLTYKQFFFLLENALKRESEKIEHIFEAAVDIIGAILGVKKKSKIENSENSISKGEFIPFGDPSKYEKLDSEEREKLTQKMIDSHKPFISNNKEVGAKKPSV